MIRKSSELSFPLLLGTAAAGLVAATSLATACAYLGFQAEQEHAQEVKSRIIAQAVSDYLVAQVEVGSGKIEVKPAIEKLLQKRFVLYPDLLEIKVKSRVGETLWSVSRPHKQNPLLNFREEQLRSVTFVEMHDASVLTVSVAMSKPGLSDFLKSTVPPLLLGCLFFSGLASLAASVSYALGKGERNRALSLALRDLSLSNYGRLTLESFRRGFDLRVQRVARAVRAVHEMRIRAQRLVASLRQTEPQVERREWLEQQFLKAQGQAIFASEKLTVRRVFAAQVQASWVTLLGTTAGVVSIWLALSVHKTPLLRSDPLVACLLYLSSTFLGLTTAKQLSLTCRGVVVVGEVLLVLAPLFAMVDLKGTSAWLVCAIAGIATGLLVRAAEGVEAGMRAPNRLHQSWVVALLPSGWALGLFGLGPSMASLTALVGPWAMIVGIWSCSLAGLTGIAFLGGLSSPWRDPIAASFKKPKRQPTRRYFTRGARALREDFFLLPFAVFLGGQLFLSFPAPHTAGAFFSLPAAAVSCLCGFGLAVGTVFPHERVASRRALKGVLVVVLLMKFVLLTLSFFVEDLASDTSLSLQSPLVQKSFLEGAISLLLGWGLGRAVCVSTERKVVLPWVIFLAMVGVFLSFCWVVF